MMQEQISQEDEEEDLAPQDEQGLYEQFRVVVDKGQAPLRIDKFLQNRILGATRNRLQQGIEKGIVLVNQKTTKANYLVKPFDDIIVYAQGTEHDDEIVPENIPLDILFEDDYLLLVNKPAGMVVHPGCGNYKGTMLNAVAYHFAKNNLDTTTLPRLGLVHRIDKNTSGILVLAKTLDAIYGMIKQFADHSIHRRYIAMAWGDMKKNQGTIKAHIGRHQRFRKKFDAYPNGEYGKDATTHYKVLQRFNYVTLIECRLETGRTHQIRVHMQHIGHNLFNDNEYGGDKILKGTVYKNYQSFIQKCFDAMPRHALHAKELGFIHPITKEKMFFESELPNDFEQLIALWTAYTLRNKML